MTARIAPAVAPFSESIQSWLLNTMPDGVAPLTLFTTLARDERLFNKFFLGGLLDQGNLTLRQREIVIHRTTALCRSEYEWGVHVALFAKRAGLGEAQLLSLASGDSGDECWNEDERPLIRLCDELHETSTVTDRVWRELSAIATEQAMLELLMLAGFYRTVSYLTNALNLLPEAFAARFPQRNRRMDSSS